MHRLRLYPLLLLLAGLGLAACDSSDPADEPDPLVVERAEDVPADPAVRDPETGETSSTSRFTFFSLRDGEIVLSYDEADRADSVSTAWDLGFRETEIIANGGENGPGQGGIQLVEGIFEEITEAPTSGYDAGLSTPWYNYSGPPNHLITPVPGRVLLVRTADGRYAKVRILSYYRGAPAQPNAFEDQDRYYTFEYVFQPDGSASFEGVE